VKSESLKKLPSDPVATFLALVNKLQFITHLSPSLKKDPRRIIVESFNRHVFGKHSGGANAKNELLKLQNCSKEFTFLSNSQHKDVSSSVTLVDLRKAEPDHGRSVERK